MIEAAVILALTVLALAVVALLYLAVMRRGHKHRWSDWDTYVLPGGMPYAQIRKCRVPSCSKTVKRYV